MGNLSMPSVALLFTGVLLVAIGLFVAGEMIIVGMGIVAMVLAGLLQVFAARRV